MEDTEVITLGKQVEKHLNGWKFGVDPDNNDRTFFKSGEMKFSFNRDWSKKDRINIGTWTWPRYTKVETGYRGGQTQTVQLTPRDLYEPPEGSPDISVAINKGAEKIAADIKRRFLPEYGRIWDRLAERARAHQEYEDKAWTDWQAICKVAGKSPASGSIYVEYNGAGSTLRVENRSGRAHIEFDASADQFSAILAALRKA